MPQPAALTSAYKAVYDAWNRLVQIGTDATPSQPIVEFQYDGVGRNTIKKSYSPPGTLSETRHLFYSLHWQVVEERVGANPNTATSDKQYVWGQRYIDDCVLRIGPDLGNSSEKIHPLQDANWNVTALVDFATGNVLERYEYDPYGARTIMDAVFASRGSSNYGWILGLSGYRLTTEVGLYFVRNRYFHAQLGRWVTRDPATIVDLTALYLYLV
jgi:RHS repeat-associated protein